MTTSSEGPVFAVTGTVSRRVADALGATDAARARLVVAANSQAEAVSAYTTAGVFGSTVRRYGGLTVDEREVSAARSAPGAVFAFSVDDPQAPPVRLSWQ